MLSSLLSSVAIYNLKCLLVCKKWYEENVVFSAVFQDRQLILFVKIPYTNDHQYMSYFVGKCVGQATKDITKNSLLLLNVIVLVYIFF